MSRAEHNRPAFVAKALAFSTLFGLSLSLSIASFAEPDEVERCWWELASSGEDGALPDCLVTATTSLSEDILPELDAAERERLGRALARAVALRARAHLSARLTRSSTSGNLRRYHVWSGSSRHVLGLRKENGRWVEATWNGESVVAHYRALAERLVSRYSFEYLLGELSGRGTIALADFERDSLGSPPAGWKRRVFGDDDGRTPYTVAMDPGSGNRFLRAEARDENVMLYKEVRWNARAYPYLAWRWRVRSAPLDSDERVEEKADSAAGVYLSYRRKLGLIPETVKFVWSVRYPVGTTFRRPGIGMPWTVVASSGVPRGAPEWRRVVYHVRDLYDETFGGVPGERPLGIAVLSDANNTGGLAAADYDDFEALATPPSPNESRVDEGFRLW